MPQIVKAEIFNSSPPASPAEGYGRLCPGYFREYKFGPRVDGQGFQDPIKGVVDGDHSSLVVPCLFDQNSSLLEVDVLSLERKNFPSPEFGMYGS